MHFSVAVIAVSMKPCIVIVLEALLKHYHDMLFLTYISSSTDFVKFYVKSRKFYIESRNKVHFSAAGIAASMKPCTVFVLDTLFEYAP